MTSVSICQWNGLHPKPERSLFSCGGLLSSYGYSYQVSMTCLYLSMKWLYTQTQERSLMKVDSSLIVRGEWHTPLTLHTKSYSSIGDEHHVNLE